MVSTALTQFNSGNTFDWMFRHPLFPQALKQHIHDFGRTFCQEAERLIEFQNACQKAMDSLLQGNTNQFTRVFDRNWRLSIQNIPYVFDWLLSIVPEHQTPEMTILLYGIVTSTIFRVQDSISYCEKQLHSLSREMDEYYRQYEVTNNAYYENMACQVESEHTDYLYDKWSDEARRDFLKHTKSYFQDRIWRSALAPFQEILPMSW